MFANLQRKNYHRNQCLMGISPARSLSLPKESEGDTSPPMLSEHIFYAK